MRILHVTRECAEAQSASPSSPVALTQLLARFASTSAHLQYGSFDAAAMSASRAYAQSAPFDVILVECDGDIVRAFNERADDDDSGGGGGGALHIARKDLWSRLLLQQISDASPLSFLVVLTTDSSATEHARWRWDCFQSGVHMVTSSRTLGDLDTALERYARVAQMKACAHASQKAPADADDGATGEKSVQVYDCPACGMEGLPEDALHLHSPLYHANTVLKRAVACPICAHVGSRYFVHLINRHGPPGRGEQPSEDDSRHQPNIVYPFALTVVRRPTDGKFLMVQEYSNSGFWLPGGRAENGESLQQAALRECLEEAGVLIELKGVLSFLYRSTEADPRDGPRGRGVTRMTCIFYAEPIAEPAQHGKTLPDYESVGACWVALDELPGLALRGSEPRKWFRYVAEGGDIYPMKLLREG